MSDFDMSAPLQRALRLEEMVIAAASSVQAADATSRVSTPFEIPAVTDAASNDDTDSSAAASRSPAQEVNTDAKAAVVAEGQAAPEFNDTLQAIRNSLEPNPHVANGSPAPDAPAQLAHSSGTQIMAVGDIAQGPHISVAQSDVPLTDAQERVAPLHLDHGIGNVAPTAWLGETVGTILETPPLPAELIAELVATLNPIVTTIGQIAGQVGGVTGELVATVPSLQGAGIDALAGLLNSNAATSTVAGWGGDVSTTVEHAMFSLPIGLDDLQQFDSGIAHGLHAAIPHAGSGLI